MSSAQEAREVRRFVRGIGKAITAQTSTMPQMKLGVVTSTSPLEVKLDGASTPSTASTMEHYTPAINDRVACVLFRNMLLIHGKVVT